MWMIDYTYRVYVQEIEEETGQIIPRLQPVDGKTVMQVFGYESDIINVDMKVVGYTDHDAIKALAKDGSTHYISDVASGIPLSGYTKEVYIKSFSSKRNKTLFQTMRDDLDCDAPVFDISLELYYDG